MQSHKTNTLRQRTSGGLWLADGGLETTLIFHHGIDLPHFASFPLLSTEAGRDRLRQYFAGFLAEAREVGAGFMLDTVTWRSGKGWSEIMGIAPDDIDAVNRDAVAFAREIAASEEASGLDIILNGVIGPHGDAYAPDRLLDAAEAEAAHERQVRVLAASGVDLITATTIANAAEGVGIARAALKADVPVAVSFTVETDGGLSPGRRLARPSPRPRRRPAVVWPGTA